MCDAIYICNTQQKLKITIDGHFSDLLRLIKNRLKPDSFAAIFGHNFNTTTSRIDLRKYMAFKAIKQLNLIDAMKTFAKLNY